MSADREYDPAWRDQGWYDYLREQAQRRRKDARARITQAQRETRAKLDRGERPEISGVPDDTLDAWLDKWMWP